ncbi:MAG: hypothetical protein ACF8PN_02530 [Phycisphaerales bacterium]
MEFIQYQEVFPALKQQGIVEAKDDENLIRLEVEPSDKLKTIHIKDPASETPPYPDARVFERSREELARLIDAILNKIHLTEVLVVPVGTWRDIIDCAAYELAEDEAWLEMDAIAAVHQNTRNPLAVTRGETNVLIDMIAALVKNAESSKQDLTITSDVRPMLIEVFHDGAVSVTADVRIQDEILRAISR